MISLTNIYRSVLLAIMLILNMFCAERTENKAIDNTEIFSNYLNKVHGYSIPKETKHFVIIPKHMGCPNCKLLTWEYFNSNKMDTNCVLICSRDYLDEINKKFRNTILIDTLSVIERLNLNTQEIAIITTREKRIINIINLNPNNINQALSELN